MNTPLPPRPVIIEIVMQQLKDLGVELILNNFGSGYSGISKILELPVDTLKFERMFMWQLETNPKSEPIVECLIKAADKLGKRLIAEGVETQRQLRYSGKSSAANISRVTITLQPFRRNFWTVSLENPWMRPEQF